MNDCTHPLYFTVDDRDGFRLDICLVCEKEFPAVEEEYFIEKRGKAK